MDDGVEHSGPEVGDVVDGWEEIEVGGVEGGYIGPELPGWWWN